jgi:hypothetical protein
MAKLTNKQIKYNKCYYVEYAPWKVNQWENRTKIEHLWCKTVQNPHDCIDNTEEFNSKEKYLNSRTKGIW